MYQEMHEGPKRGVSIYSYSGEYGWSMDLEDCFADMRDMGAHGLEILGNAHIDGYPNPSEAWLDRWFYLLDKYEIIPVEYGHWIDSRTYAHDYMKNGREIIRRALPMAEEYNVRMCPELHIPTRLKSAYVDEYMDFILQTNTKYFGFNVDFGDENFEETTIPYREIIRTLKDNHWDGYMLSEYEGPHKDEPGFVSDQLRRQHIMMWKSGSAIWRHTFRPSSRSTWIRTRIFRRARSCQSPESSKGRGGIGGVSCWYSAGTRS